MVAPRAGAWIETVRITNSFNGFKVAPRAGAWIETTTSSMSLIAGTSRPARARGLKLLKKSKCVYVCSRAPRGRVD